MLEREHRVGGAVDDHGGRPDLAQPVAHRAARLDLERVAELRRDVVGVVDGVLGDPRHELLVERRRRRTAAPARRRYRATAARSAPVRRLRAAARTGPRPGPAGRRPRAPWSRSARARRPAPGARPRRSARSCRPGRRRRASPPAARARRGRRRRRPRGRPASTRPARRREPTCRRRASPGGSRARPWAASRSHSSASQAVIELPAPCSSNRAGSPAAPNVSAYSSHDPFLKRMRPEASSAACGRAGAWVRRSRRGGGSSATAR